MKFLLIILLFSVGPYTLVQGAVPSRLKTRITDDSRTLSIQIIGNKNGQTIQYNRTFDVAGMGTLRKELLRYRVFTALGLPLPLHEIPWLIFVALGSTALMITILVVCYQTRETASLKSL